MLLLLFPVLSRSPAKALKPDSFGTLAKIGVQTALSFVFSFMKRSWKSGEDMDLCSSVLGEACELLEALPPGSMFLAKSYSNIWIESVDKVTSFLATIVTR